jgi:hypothetical protein
LSKCITNRQRGKFALIGQKGAGYELFNFEEAKKGRLIAVPIWNSESSNFKSFYGTDPPRGRILIFCISCFYYFERFQNITNITPSARALSATRRRDDFVLSYRVK